MKQVALILGVLVAGVAWSAPARAKNTYPPLIPNGDVNECDNCHIDINESRTFTWFGADVLLTADSWLDPIPDWSRVWMLDSDRDGQTNGAELGDPCGEWEKGDTPSYEDVSLPGDELSMLEAPPDDICTVGDSGETGDSAGPELADPAPSCLYSVLGARGSAALWLFGAAWLVLRRHREERS